MAIKTKNVNIKARHARVRKKVAGTAAKPSLFVYRSNANIQAQIIDDAAGTTLIAASSLDASIKGEVASTSNKEAAKRVGELVAKRALEKGIEDVVFDRGGYLYHGRV